MYIVFEGIDTAGKSTQIELLKEQLSDTLITREPGGTPFGKVIREIVLGHEELDPMTELLLFLADRREHYKQVVEPAMAQEKAVISDRSFISGIAYALTNRGFETNQLIDLNLMTLNGTLPDAVILFKIPKETLIERLSAKTIDGIEKRGIEYLLKVQEALIDTTRHLCIKHIVINAADSIESIHKQILEFIKREHK